MSGDPRTTRRRLLAAGSSVALLSLAGCLGNDDDDEGDVDDADDAEEDDGDDDTVDDADDTTDEAADEDVADDDHDDEDDDHADDHDDHADDRDHEDDHDDDHDHEDLVTDFALVERDADEEVGYIHDDHWHGDLPPIPLEEYVSLGGVFEDGDGEEIPIGEDEEYQLNAEVAEGAQEGIVEIDTHGDHVHLAGEEEGRTDLVFQLWHDDHADWESPAITAEVTADVEDHEADDDHDDHDHDDGHDHDDNHDHDDHEHADEDDHADDHEHDDDADDHERDDEDEDDDY